MTIPRIPLSSSPLAKRVLPKSLGRIVRVTTSDGSEARVLEAATSARRHQSNAMQTLSPGAAASGRSANAQRSGRSGVQTPPRPPSPTGIAPDASSRLQDRISGEMKRLAPAKLEGRLADLDDADINSPAEAHRSGAGEHVQNLTCGEFSDPASGRRYLITNAESRVFSAAKHRRYVMDDKGRFFCGLQFKPVEQLMRSDTYGFGKRKAMFEANIREELAKDVVFNKDTYVHKLLKDEDGSYLALIDNLPDEASYLLNTLPDEHFVGGLVKLLEEVSERVSEDFHSKGYLHGDLKMENIMITPARRFVPIDFESVAPVEANGMADIQRCTWAAPEMQRPKNRSSYFGRVGQAADVYAVGISLLHAVASRTESQRISKLPASQQPVAAEHSDAMVKEALAYLGSDAFTAVRAKYLANDPNLYANPDAAAFRPILQPFHEQAPELLRFVLGSMVNVDPAERASMAAVNAAAQMIALGTADKVLAADKALGESIEKSMSAFVEPLLRKAGEQQWQPAGPSLSAIGEEEP